MTHWSTQDCVVYETLGTDTTNSRGTAVTASASANTKGTWIDIGSPTSRDYQSLWVGLTPQGTAATDYLVDIGISDGTNRWVIMPNLRLAGLGSNASGGVMVRLPLHIPGGSQLSARCQASTGSRFCIVTLMGSSMGMGGAPGYAYGVQLYTDANSRGEDIDPTTANTKTAWAQLGSGASTTPLNAVLVAVGPGAQVTRTTARNYLLDIARGNVGSEFAFLANLPLIQALADQRPLPCYMGPFPISLSNAGRVSARCQTNDVTAGERKIDVAVWGFI